MHSVSPDHVAIGIQLVIHVLVVIGRSIDVVDVFAIVDVVEI